jgi:opacity protein-like surface antigen
MVGFTAMGLLAFPRGARADSNLTGNINFSLGQKFLESDWDKNNTDLRDQFEFGALFDFRPQTWPINIAVDFLGSTIKDNGITGSTGEFAVGVRKYFLENTNIQPFVGGGVTSITGKQSHRDRGSIVSIDDTGIGPWLMAGVQFRPATHLNLGFNVRYSHARVTFLDDDMDAGGVHYGLFAGYAF